MKITRYILKSCVKFVFIIDSMLQIPCCFLQTVAVSSELLDDGFSCPEGEVIGPNGRALPHPTFPHPEDCQKFYICRNGVMPQRGYCPSGTVYNEESFKCDEPENVPGW